MKRRLCFFILTSAILTITAIAFGADGSTIDAYLQDNYTQNPITASYWVNDGDDNLVIDTTGTDGHININLQPTGIEDFTVPDNYKVADNFPNPFTSYTSINAALPVGKDYSLSLFNVLGQNVLHREHLTGVADIQANIANGVYFAVIKSGDQVYKQKMTFLGDGLANINFKVHAPIQKIDGSGINSLNKTHSADNYTLHVKPDDEGYEPFEYEFVNDGSTYNETFGFDRNNNVGINVNDGTVSKDITLTNLDTGDNQIITTPGNITVKSGNYAINSTDFTIRDTLEIASVDTLLNYQLQSNLKLEVIDAIINSHVYANIPVFDNNMNQIATTNDSGYMSLNLNTPIDTLIIGNNNEIIKTKVPLEVIIGKNYEGIIKTANTSIEYDAMTDIIRGYNGVIHLPDAGEKSVIYLNLTGVNKFGLQYDMTQRITNAINMLNSEIGEFMTIPVPNAGNRDSVEVENVSDESQVIGDYIDGISQYNNKDFMIFNHVYGAGGYNATIPSPDSLGKIVRSLAMINTTNNTLGLPLTEIGEEYLGTTNDSGLPYWSGTIFAPGVETHVLDSNVNYLVEFQKVDILNIK